MSDFTPTANTPSVWRGVDPQGISLSTDRALLILRNIPSAWSEFEKWQAFASHPNEAVRATYAFQHPLTQAIQSWILQNNQGYPSVLGSLAANVHADPFLLVILSQNLNPDVRVLVVENPTVSMEVLSTLAVDPDPFVAAIAGNKLSERLAEAAERQKMTAPTLREQSRAMTSRVREFAESVGSVEPVQDAGAAATTED